MPRQEAPPSRVRTIEVQGGCPHGALPNTQPCSALTNVAEYGVNPPGTGPPTGPAGTDAEVVEVWVVPLPVVAVGADVEPDDAPGTSEGGGDDDGGSGDDGGVEPDEQAETSTQHRPAATTPSLATQPRTTPPPSRPTRPHPAKLYTVPPET